MRLILKGVSYVIYFVDGVRLCENRANVGIQTYRYVIVYYVILFGMMI